MQAQRPKPHVDAMLLVSQLESAPLHLFVKKMDGAGTIQVDLGQAPDTS